MQLKHFVHPDHPALFEIRRSDGRCDLRSVAKASVVRDFYTFTDKRGEKHYDVEHGLGKLETKNAPTICKLIESGVNSLDEEERAFLSNFLAIQLHRTKLMRAFADESYNQLLDPAKALEFFKQIKPTVEKDFDRQEIEDFESKLRSGQPLDMDKNFFIKYCLPPASPRFAFAINEMHWRIECAKHNESVFVVGDVPVAVRRRGRLSDPTYVGIERKDLDAEMYFPLSYNKLLIASWKKSRSRRVYASRFRVTELNKIAIVSSFESVFAPVDTDEIIDLVRSLSSVQVRKPPFDILKN